MGRSRLLGLGLGLGLGLPACSLAFDYPESTEEDTFTTCTDGVDNDFNGLIDCQEELCRCNACTEDGMRPVVAPPTDALGKLCQENCQCRPFAAGLNLSSENRRQVCNQRALVEEARLGGRCLAVESLGADGEVSVEEGRFSVSFLVQQTPEGNVDAERSPQNVVGRAQLDGQIFEFDRAEWRGQRLEFRNLDRNLVLEVVLMGRSPADDEETYLVTDRIGEDTGWAVRAPQLGPFSTNETPGVNQLAIVETSALSIARVGDSVSSSNFVRGRWSGRLRPPAAIDRVRGGVCPEGLFHPDGRRCFVGESGTDTLFALGCVLDRMAPRGSGPTAPQGSGLFAFRWPLVPGFGVALESVDGGECVARIDDDDDTLEIRARNSPLQTVTIALRARLPMGQVSPGTSITVEGATRTDPPYVRVYRLTGEDVLKPLFDLALDSGDRTEVQLESGRVSVERLVFGAQPRFFGWIEGKAAP